MVTQLSTSLPGVSTYVTTHDAENHKSKIHSTREAKWTPFDDKKFAMSTIYTFANDVDMTDEKDITESDSIIEEGKQGLVGKGCTVWRYVDIKPSYTTLMHRTQSWDLGIVIEGTVELIMEDGSSTLVRRGDTVVQRGTMHAWRNPSEDAWTRMIFVLQHVQSLKVGGKELGEDLGSGVEGLPSSH